MRDRQSIIRREWSRNASGEAKRLPPFSFRLPQFALVAAFDPFLPLGGRGEEQFGRHGGHPGPK